jgi:hypothetical protein
MLWQSRTEQDSDQPWLRGDASALAVAKGGISPIRRYLDIFLMP